MSGQYVRKLAERALLLEDFIKRIKASITLSMPVLHVLLFYVKKQKDEIGMKIKIILIRQREYCILTLQRIRVSEIGLFQRCSHM